MPRGQNRAGGRGARRARALHSQLKLLSHKIEAADPRRIRSNVQLVSIPNHQFQLKTKKVFRIFSKKITGVVPVFTLAGIRNEIYKELGIATLAAGATFNIAVHDIRVYVSASGPSNVRLDLFNIEHDNQTDIAHWGTFDDISSGAGIGHIHAVFPTNERPTWSLSSIASNLFKVTVAPTDAYLVCDLDCTVQITSPTAATFDIRDSTCDVTAGLDNVRLATNATSN